MAKDIQIVPAKSGEITLDLLGKSEDNGLLLLQRLYVLMLSDLSSDYRGGAFGNALLAFLEGGNTPPDTVLTSMLGVACAAAVLGLDAADRALVSSFSAVAINGDIQATLKLSNGTTLTGIL